MVSVTSTMRDFRGAKFFLLTLVTFLIYKTYFKIASEMFQKCARKLGGEKADLDGDSGAASPSENRYPCSL